MLQLQFTWTSVANLIDWGSSTIWSSSGAWAWVNFTFARKLAVSKVCITSDTTSPSNIKMNFKDDGTTITNTQNIKIHSSSLWRVCYDINTTKAKSVYVSWYPGNSI